MIDTNKILVIVPARGGSKGIKKKNIYPVKGKPLINYTDELVNSCKWIDYAVVSTDDEHIGKMSKLNFDFFCSVDIVFSAKVPPRGWFEHMF